MLDDDVRDFTSGSAGLQPLDIGIRQQSHIGKVKGRIDAESLSVGLCIDETGIAITGVAANALARVGTLFVDLEAKWCVKGFKSELLKIVAELLDARLVADGRMRIRTAGVRLGRILAASSVDVVEALGL